ncbi:MAG: protein phosphatase 2C domain-containing protein [Pseudomonadota bacterium]
MKDTSTLHWSSASASHVGKVRRHNEDAYLDLSERKLWVVADGMGGHAVGDVASRMIVDALKEVPAPKDLEEYIDEVSNCLQTVNQQLINEAAQRHETVIGSTVVTLLAHENRYACIWAGDSRLYLSRDGILSQLSRDHSHVEELVTQGLLNRRQAKNYPGSNAITRAIGATNKLQLDSKIEQARDGDVYLLCSDGLTNEVGDDEIATELARGNYQQICNNLLDSALNHGARDNISIVVVRVDDPLLPTTTIVNPLTSGNKSPI